MSKTSGIRTFSQILTKLRESRRVEIDADWLQGRTAFGGLGVAIGVSTIAQALKAGLPPNQVPPPLKSLLVSFAGPIGEGLVQPSATVLRLGKNISLIEAKVMQDGRVATAIQAAYGAGQSEKCLPLPRRIDLPNLKDFEADEFLPEFGMPKFLKHFEMRWAKGRPWMRDASDTNKTKSGIWCRLKDEGAGGMLGEPYLFPEARLIALADLPPPIMFLHYPFPVPASSLTWKLDFLVAPERTAESEWFFLDYTLEVAENGFSIQSGLVYDEKGVPVAMSRQTMVYFEKQATSKL